MSALDFIDWPLMAKSIAAGAGLGSIYGVGTGEFVFGVVLGVMSGFGFAVGRSYTK